MTVASELPVSIYRVSLIGPYCDDTHISPIFTKDNTPDAIIVPNKLADTLITRPGIPEPDNPFGCSSSQHLSSGICASALITRRHTTTPVLTDAKSIDTSSLAIRPYPIVICDLAQIYTKDRSTITLPTDIPD